MEEVLVINWFQYYQILKEDKENYGFKDKSSPLEEIILENESKLISKIYKLLLTWFIEDETVKESMIKWALNFSRTVKLTSWEYLWAKTQKISPCVRIKENCFKNRCYLTPKKIVTHL